MSPFRGTRVSKRRRSCPEWHGAFSKRDVGDRWCIDRAGVCGGILYLLTNTIAASAANAVEIGTNVIPARPPSFPPAEQAGIKAPTVIPDDSLWNNTTAPLPTNAWWDNLVLGGGVNTIAPLPYLLQAEQQGLAVCYPALTATENFVLSTFLPNFRITVNEKVSQRHVTRYDDLSVTLEWRSPQGSAKTTLVQGSPYITVVFNNLTPMFGSIHAIIQPTNSIVANREKLRIEMNNGQTWLVYASSPINITFGGAGEPGMLTSPFSGIIRIALARDGDFEGLLDANRYIIPVAGKVHLSHKATAGTIKYDFETASFGQESGDLLLMALPHHIDAGLVGIQASENQFTTIKGNMTGILGTLWEMKSVLPSISWIARSPISPQKVSAVASALEDDQHMIPVAEDPYFFGKEIAAMGRLALIADEIGERRIARNIIERMKGHLEPWLTSSNPDALVYDDTWGGVVSTFGMQDARADFGNGAYNDHHYHYGYLVYAAAVIGRTDPVWLNTYEFEVLDLVRDFANPNREDPYFPYSRHKDMYAWHSWAGGLFSAADAKNQESTSEAVNAYYAVYLLGLAFHNKELAAYGRIMMQMEISAAQKYWHVVDTEIYPQPYSDRTVVGVLWSTKVDHATWFGANLEYIHGIQILPVTPISEALLRPEWISKSYPVASTATGASDEWLGYIYMAHAVIDQELAWQEVQELEAFLGGNTKTNTLYWVATRSTATPSNQAGPPRAISVEGQNGHLMEGFSPRHAPAPSRAPNDPPLGSFVPLGLIWLSIVLTCVL